MCFERFNTLLEQLSTVNYTAELLCHDSLLHICHEILTLCNTADKGTSRGPNARNVPISTTLAVIFIIKN